MELKKDIIGGFTYPAEKKMTTEEIKKNKEKILKKYHGNVFIHFVENEKFGEKGILFSKRPLEKRKTNSFFEYYLEELYN